MASKETVPVAGVEEGTAVYQDPADNPTVYHAIVNQQHGMQVKHVANSVFHIRLLYRRSALCAQPDGRGGSHLQVDKNQMPALDARAYGVSGNHRWINRVEVTAPQREGVERWLRRIGQVPGSAEGTDPATLFQQIVNIPLCVSWADHHQTNDVWRLGNDRGSSWCLTLLSGKILRT